MKISYDREANAAYISLVSITPSGVAKTYPCDPVAVRGMINPDFDKDGRLIGVEVLDARSKLAPSILEMAERQDG